MSDPFYIRQSGETRTFEEQMQWFKQCAEEAKSEGAQLCRFSRHPDDVNRLLVECWREKVMPDQGPLRWSITYSRFTGAEPYVGWEGSVSEKLTEIDAQNTPESLREAHTQPKRDSEVYADLGVETPATGQMQGKKMDFDEKAEDAVNAVLHVSCFGEGCDFDFDDHSRLVKSISAALEEAYHQGRKSEMSYGRQLAAIGMSTVDTEAE